jgi:hypothetical protein
MQRLLQWLTIAAVAGSAGAAAAASFELSAAERAEAIQVGQRSITRESVSEEWELKTDTGALTVMTPFHRLALAARQAAFKQKPLSPREIEAVLREDRGRLVFWAAVRGARGNFARFYQPVLLVGDGQVRPAFVQNEHTALPQPDGSYLARCVYGFRTGTLTGTTRVVLVIRDVDGTEVARFPVDLAAVR